MIFVLFEKFIKSVIASKEPFSTASACNSVVPFIYIWIEMNEIKHMK